MSRKNFSFNRSLNTNLSAVENVFDDLTKTSKLKQQLIENTNDKNSTSSIVSNIEKDIVTNIQDTISSNNNSSVLTDTKTSISTNKDSNISMDIETPLPSSDSSNTNSDTLSGMLLQTDVLATDKPTNNFSVPIITKTDNPEKLTVRSLSKWHTEAEQKVYRVLYDQTIALDRNSWYFSFNELVKKTGFKSKITIAVAIDGLADKKSIDILTDKRGDHLGKRYKVYTPSQILLRREESNINIDPQTKKII